MSHGHKFDPKEMERLKDPERSKREPIGLIWEKMGLENPGCIIDIGAGVGYAAIPFAEKMEGGTVYATDISQEMLDALEKELQKAGVTNVKPILTGEVEVPLEDATADCVYTQNLYHEFHQLYKSLAEFKRLLKPGGKLVVIDWKPGESPHGPPQNVRVKTTKIEEDLIETGFSLVTNLDVLPYHSFVIAVKPLE